MKYFEPHIQVSRYVYISFFKINALIFCCSIFFEECLNPQIRINKMVNVHNDNYYPSLSELSPRIHLLKFLWIPRGFISPEYFLNFFSNLCIVPWLRKCFKFMVLRLLENAFVSQKFESVHFCSIPQAKFSPRL